jgi:hypothetical protein
MRDRFSVIEDMCRYCSVRMYILIGFLDTRDKSHNEQIYFSASCFTYSLAKPTISLGAWYSGTFMSSADPVYPRSSPVSMAHFSPMSSAVLYVLQPTLSGQMDKSATLRPFTPCTFRRSSSTPCLTMELPSLGAMEHVPSECHVVST